MLTVFISRFLRVPAPTDAVLFKSYTMAENHFKITDFIYCSATTKKFLYLATALS